MNGALALPDRLARFREAAGKMDEALREEGFDEHGSHAIFVRWQRESVEGLGGILLEAEKTMGERVETACARIEEASRRFRDDEFRRAEILLTSGQEALSMARQAADTAAATGERAEQVFNASVAKIAKELSVKLLDECQQWLVLKQTQHNRRDARRLAVGVAAAALAVFVGGYAMATGQRDGGGAGRGFGGRAVLEEAGHVARLEGRAGRNVPPSGSRAEAGRIADGS